ncbi:uncharacterized protein YbiU-like [Tigriopus californicus]|uniref:uncharacterized protein YbiU-like n=1 Tax=Tigriopus californicus TaxID=6832 RepID=UPI0027D9E078|nr:uncharacterized protein YbiU-like [Tigriopus californicus]
MKVGVFFVLTIICIGVQSVNLNEGGSINDLFVTDGDSDHESMQYSKVKKAMQVEPDFARRLFQVVEEKLQVRLDELSIHGNSIIPTVTMKAIEENGHRLPDDVAMKVKKHGVLVVRNTLPEEEVQQLMDDLHNYLLINNIDTATYNETVYEIYWSQSQLRARQHHNMYMVQDALLKLWTLQVPNLNCSQISPAMYIDRLRIRKPGDTSFTLPFHIDGGGIERWSDPVYRKVYEQIFKGNLDAYDPFAMDYRIQAAMNEEGHANGCTFFRAFQGWLATSPTGPGKGTLKVLPILKRSHLVLDAQTVSPRCSRPSHARMSTREDIPRI